MADQHSSPSSSDAMRGPFRRRGLTEEEIKALLLEGEDEDMLDEVVADALENDRESLVDEVPQVLVENDDEVDEDEEYRQDDSEAQGKKNKVFIQNSLRYHLGLGV